MMQYRANNTAWRLGGGSGSKINVEGDKSSSHRSSMLVSSTVATQSPSDTEIGVKFGMKDDLMQLKKDGQCNLA